MTDRATPEGLRELLEHYKMVCRSNLAASMHNDEEVAEIERNAIVEDEARILAYATRLAGQAVQGQPLAFGRWAEGLDPGTRLLEYDGHPLVHAAKTDFCNVPLYASTPPALPLPEPSGDLVQRCQEIQAWHKTSILPEGALRKLAETRPEVPGHIRLTVAENATNDEAREFVILAATLQAVQQPQTWADMRYAPDEPVAQAVQQEVPWRCFHCEESFTDKDAARLHFGTSEHHQPACQIDVAEYRAMEARMRAYNEEDTELHRDIHRLESKHAVERRSEEEKGYARGLRDSKSCPCAASQAQAEQGVAVGWQGRKRAGEVAYQSWTAWVEVFGEELERFRLMAVQRPDIFELRALFTAPQPSPAGAVPRDMLHRLVEIIERNEPWNWQDHACAECVPHSTMLKPDWQCAVHRAKSMLAAPSAAPLDARDGDVVSLAGSTMVAAGLSNGGKVSVTTTKEVGWYGFKLENSKGEVTKFALSDEALTAMVKLRAEAERAAITKEKPHG